VAALAALLLAVFRRSPGELGGERKLAVRAFVVTLMAQGLRFGEETITSFHIAFPNLFSQPPMPFLFFMLFNLAWIGLWIAAVPALREARTWAFFAAWFLAIAGAFNGIAHPVMALMIGGYFPDLLSSPLIGLAGALLCLRLARATRLNTTP
jgi:hypothetical protein